ncbi:hypothetical protein, partial [Pseudomonas syringae group genomosp. 3]|uniref:hypothetical protein n=1 Tax=Pseudomonas syringae group genomosp. 3 TaxID=251701 RepID=UPI001C809683
LWMLHAKTTATLSVELYRKQDSPVSTEKRNDEAHCNYNTCLSDRTPINLLVARRSGSDV